ncbi:MAG: TetR/AcrR family transcriptional regulator [Eubacterium sp.]|nr:TetR/AcrR family transcriptional regulator [Eubacterium sp.]
MAQERKENRNALRSKRLIKEAFLELIQEKPVSKITVTEIIRLADINRSTFYAHYPDVYGVLEAFEDDTVDKLMSILTDFDYKNFFSNPLPLLLRINRYIDENLELYQTLIKQNGADSVFRKLHNTFIEYMRNSSDIPEEFKSSAMFEIRIHFFAGGILSLYKNWLMGDIQSELNDISLDVAKILKESSKELMG